MIRSEGVRRTRNDNISVACADCPKCGKENVVARVASARSGFNSAAERGITCKKCGDFFKTEEARLVVRRHTREQVDMEYGVDALPWIE
jgi:transcription elongation factor Elf1